MPIVAKITTITPELAGKLLENCNDHNRDVIESRVRQYAADMRKGDWIVNGEAIKISETKRVIDGQHRLLAICEARVPVTTLLVAGLPDTAQESLDQGRPRGFHDVLKLRGEKDYNNLAAAARMLAVYERDGVPFVTGGWRAAPSNHLASRTLARNGELRDALRFAHTVGKPWLLPRSTIAVLYHLQSIANLELAVTFWKQLAGDAFLGDGNPINTLRNRLILEHENTTERRVSARAKSAFVVLAWNALAQHRQLRDSEMKWTMSGPDAQPFPLIHGLASHV